MNLLQEIEKYIKGNSHLDIKRDYIGMSGLGNCLKDIYKQAQHGITPDAVQYRNSFRGYQQEKFVKKMLIDIGFMRQGSERELTYGLNEMVKGHIDGETVAGDLIEIKSLNLEKFTRLKEGRRLARRHFFQVQTYMHFGNYQRCFAVIACPETTEFDMLVINRIEIFRQPVQAAADAMIKAMLEQAEPECSCIKCSPKK